MKILNGFDVNVKEACTNWLKWPKDAPKGLFYCAVHQGGLSFLCLGDDVPILFTNRFDNLRKSLYPLVGTVFEVESPLKQWAEIRSGVRLTSCGESRRLWKAELDRSADERALAEHGGLGHMSLSGAAALY